MTRIRTSLESSALMDRGGRPTLRELLGGLEFDAATGALRLNGARLALYHSEADRILRRELIARLGEAEARIFLLRRGFRMGLHDAAFVAASWPALDRGDAFTAGTRLHMFSGIVRVETQHNDFDFARGRFNAEFLWHNSIEAEAAGDPLRPAHGPACWQQLGYASGYASHFFGALVVYKETACAAQGHKCCRVVGRLAEGWGEEDAEVRLFRSRIEPAAHRQPQIAPPPLAGPSEGLEARLLAPVLPQLEQAAGLPLPCLIAGAGHAGQTAAALHLARLQGAEAQRLPGAGLEVGALSAAFAAHRKPRRKEVPQLLLIEGVEEMPPAVQVRLAGLLAEAEPQLRPRMALTSGLTLSALAAGGIAPPLWIRLMPLAVELPALSARGGDMADLAARLLTRLAHELGLADPGLAPGAAEALAPAGLDGLEAVLTAALVEGGTDEPLTAAALARHQLRIAAPDTAPDAAFALWLDQRLAAGGFSLDAHEAQIRAAAMARAGGNLSAAARLLGISRAQLAYREKPGKA
ncbi:XylR N-terminal domain-containing protein [Neotabrizicola sp. VNH66]|uniref:XylR N-terminal domain-containing protein n=1 Tax=Neotabrizicola sp. VNH66 TaxID=3400918 RepID=UPI003C113C28